jgi:hypothetical protein
VIELESWSGNDLAYEAYEVYGAHYPHSHPMQCPVILESHVALSTGLAVERRKD